MKYISLIALIGYTAAIKIGYAESEGPTKADNGENDEDVMPREGIEAKVGNPLYWKDTGDMDDTVVLQTDGQAMVLKRTKKHHHHKSHSLAQGKPKRDRQSGPVDGAGRPIYDADGDGVEDNVERTREELDRFYIPNMFFPTEDIYNTHHGNLPGHVRKAEYMGRPDYRSPFFHPELSDGRFRTAAGLESRGDGTYADVFGQND